MADEDPKYTKWLRSLPCCKCGTESYPRCVHHRIGDKKGLALKAHDHEGIPLCHLCHRDFHSSPYGARFRGWTRQQRDEWQAEQVRHFRGVYLDEGTF